MTGDGNQPKCGRCQQANKDCVYETGRRFRRSSIQESFSDAQQWVSLPPRSTTVLIYRRYILLTLPVVQFLDESQEIRSQYASDPDYSAFFPSTPVVQDFSPDPSYSSSGVNQVETPPPSIVSPTEGLTVLSLLNANSPTHHQHSHSHSAPPTSSYEPHVSPSPIQYNGSFVYQQPPGVPVLWPLEHEQEAMLLQHYLDNVALFVSDARKCMLYALITHSLTWSMTKGTLATTLFRERKRTAH